MPQDTERGDIVDRLNSTPHVKRYVEDELRRRQEDRYQSDEPTVTFSVRLGASDMGLLENLGSYLGQKKTPFASQLLHDALQDALYAAMNVELENGTLEDLKQHLGQRVEFEGGWVESNYGAAGEAS